MKAVLFANTEWYLYNFRLSLAQRLRDQGHDVLLISPPGPYGERLRALGFRWQPVPMARRSLNPFREILLIARLRRLFREEAVQLVHGFTIKCAVYGSIAARLAGLKARVSSVAGMGYVFTSGDLKARLLRLPVRLLMRLAFGGRNAAVIVQNPDDQHELLSAGIVAAGHLQVIPGSGVDTGRFAAVVPQPSPDGRIRVTLAGRMLWDKGVGEFVEAARQLRADGCSIDWVLAGTPDAGNPAAIPETQLQEWCNDGTIQWLGHVEDMPDLLSKTDIMVLPSYREGLPRSVIEAAAAGLPIVTTDVAGCRAVVQHEVNGLLVPARDSKALAAAIRRLVEDPELGRRLGKAAQEKAIAEYDQGPVNEATLAVYRRLLGEDASA